MNCEHRCYKSASPHRIGHLLQRNKKKDGRQGVEEYVRKMMPSCLQPVQLAVEHMRHSGQRMPVHGMNMSECPGNTANAEPTSYFRVFIDVARIVIINEVVPERLAEKTRRPSCVFLPFEIRH